jgi:hypothetical protein
LRIFLPKLPLLSLSKVSVLYSADPPPAPPPDTSNVFVLQGDGAC